MRCVRGSTETEEAAPLDRRRRRLPRKPECERTSCTRYAGKRNLAAERAREPATDRQADSRPCRSAGIEACELLKHQPLFVDWNPWSVVGDADGHPPPAPWRVRAVRGVYGNGDVAIRLRVFHGVGYEIRQNLTHPRQVRLDDENILIIVNR